MTLASDAVRVTDNLDVNGELPAEGDHEESRAQNPARVHDVSNLRGLGVHTHRQRHDHGIQPGTPPNLSTIW